jgi:ubiquinone/menaquinone biosynthesis C-methylase UbiE
MAATVAKSTPADWQLPPGVDRGLWDYLHNRELAQNYDASLASSSLPQVDVAFVERQSIKQGRLIDLGCGTGRLLLAFASRGWRVLGVDLSEEMLTVARRKAATAGLAIELLRANLTELGFLADSSFDLAACLFSTLGMIRGADNRRRVAAGVFRLLRPGGLFVLHVHNRWYNAWDRGGRAWLMKDWLQSTFGGAEGGDRLMPVHQGVAGLTLHLFSRREIVRLLREVGFRIVEVLPLSPQPDGQLPWPACFGWLRAYGYLLAAEKPGE